MARGTWDLYRKITGVWTYLATIYRPNANLTLKKTSTQTKTKLADGSYGYIMPETKYNDEMLSLSWGYLPKTYKDQIEGYVNNAYDIRITDHNNTYYYGRFVSVNATWLVGEVDKYDVAAEFEIMPGLNT